MIENESRIGKKELIAFNMLQMKKLIVPMALFFIVLPATLLSGLFDDDPSTELLITMLLIGIPVAIALGTFINMRKLIKSDKLMENVTTIHYLFGDDVVEIETKQGTTESRGKFEYAILHKAVETKDYLFLYKNAILGYVVCKAGFIQGNANQLKDLLRGKGIKLTEKR